MGRVGLSPPSASLLRNFPQTRPSDLRGSRCKRPGSLDDNTMSDLRRRDPRRKQKEKAVDSDRDSSGEEQLCTQKRASLHSRKQQKAPTGNIIIKGDVHIKQVKGDFNLIQGRKDEPRSQSSTSAARASTRRIQSTKTRQTLAQCDSPILSDEEEMTESGESDHEYIARHPPKRPPRAHEQLRLHSDKKKRDQPDEGYHTSGTVSYTRQVPGRAKGKDKERSVSSGLAGSSSTRTRVSSASGSGRSRGRGTESELQSRPSDASDFDEELAKEVDRTERNERLDEEVASDDDFWNLPVHIGNPNNQDAQAIERNAILDTGTKVDWISQMFYDQLRDIGVRLTRLSSNELEMQYLDFNGKKFQPTGKVDLLIQTDEIKGPIKCKTMQFFVASKATFAILLGRDTIRKHGFLTRNKRDTDGEGVHIGVHEDLTKAQEAEIKRKKEESKQVAKDRKKERDLKTEKSIRQKENVSSSSSSKGAVHLATSVSRSSKTGPPPKDSPRESSSSMEGTW